jgi:hypothetical protein
VRSPEELARLLAEDARACDGGDGYRTSLVATALAEAHAAGVREGHADAERWLYNHGFVDVSRRVRSALAETDFSELNDRRGDE